MRLVLFTSAPEILDGPHTRPLGHAGMTATGQVLRAVEVELCSAVEQAQRYLANGAVVYDEDEWRAAVKCGAVYSDRRSVLTRRPARNLTDPPR